MIAQKGHGHSEIDSCRNNFVNFELFPLPHRPINESMSYLQHMFKYVQVNLKIYNKKVN